MPAPIAPSPYAHAFAVTPSDTTVFNPPTSGLYVGTAGDNLAVVMNGDTSAVTFIAVPIGFLPLSVSKVMATNTTTSNIIGLS